MKLKSPFRIIFPAYSQRQSTHQCCQYFDDTLVGKQMDLFNLLDRSMYGKDRGIVKECLVIIMG